MFFAIISAEILRICRATSPVAQFIRTSKAFLHRMLTQGVDALGVKKVLVKMINRIAVKVGSIQEKSRFTVAKGESRNSTVVVGRMLVFSKNSVKR